MEGQDLIAAAQGAGYEARSYSGRGMYGKPCVGIDVPREVSLFSFALELYRALADSGADEGAAFEALDELSSLAPREDSMGLDKIIYFPSVRWPNTQNRFEEE